RPRRAEGRVAAAAGPPGSRHRSRRRRPGRRWPRRPRSGRRSWFGWLWRGGGGGWGWGGGGGGAGAGPGGWGGGGGGVGAGAGWVVAGPASVADVIGRLRVLIVGLLAALATLFLTIGGVRYLAANGDPGGVAKAKDAFKNAAFGYALAALAPLLVSVLQQVVS